MARSLNSVFVMVSVAATGVVKGSNGVASDGMVLSEGLHGGRP
jgi:hypothetical protein